MKLSFKSCLLIILLGSISLSACMQFNPAAADLSNTSWSLTLYGNQQPLPGSSVTLRFEDGQIQGSAGCNTYFGSYKIRGSSLTITDLGWTEMACLDPKGVMLQEQEIMSLLSKAESFEQLDNRLEILTKEESKLEFLLKN